MIYIIEICNCVIIVHSLWRLLLLCKSKILDSTLVIQIIWLNHFNSWLVNLWILCSDWSDSFLLSNIVISSWVSWASTLSCRFVVLGLISSIIISIIIQKCSSAHIGGESLTSFYLFEILFFAFDRVRIILSIDDRRHLGHERMGSFLVFIIS